MLKIRKCEKEGCSNRFIEDYGYSLSLQWLVTGHSYVSAFICHKTNSTSQHWGCCIQHALDVMQECLSNHMGNENIESRHMLANFKKIINTNEDGTKNEIIMLSPKFSEEDRKWAEKRGEDFHIVKNKQDYINLLTQSIEDW